MEKIEYKVGLFDKNHSDRNNFECTELSMTNYFKQTISQDVKRDLCAAYVVYSIDESKILGFFTLSQYSIKRSESSKNKGNYSRVPTTLLGRLAIHKNYEGKGLGKRVIVNDILKIHLEISRKIGSAALILEAKDNARGFYEKLKIFKDYPSEDNDEDFMFLSTGNIRSFFK